MNCEGQYFQINTRNLSSFCTPRSILHSHFGAKIDFPNRILLRDHFWKSIQAANFRHKLHDMKDVPKLHSIYSARKLLKSAPKNLS